MLIEFNVTSDLKDNDEIIVDKFFQFLVIGKKQRNEKRKVEIYTSLCFHSTKGTPNSSLLVEVKVDGKKEESDLIFDAEDKYNFFKKVEIIKQFWGDNTEKFKRKKDLKNKINNSFNTKYNDDIIESLYDNDIYKEGLFPVFVSNKDSSSDGEQSDLEEFVLLPNYFLEQEGSIELKGDCSKLDDEVRSNISHGFWFKHTTTIEFDIYDGVFQFNHHVKFNHLITSPDFKIYYQLPEDHDVKKNSISIKGDKEIKAEVHQVYSQSSTNYFDEWVQGGIESSPLIRLNNTISINDMIKNDGLSKLVSSINVEDKNRNFRKEVKIFIFSILLSVLFSIGFDYTRVYADEMRLFFNSSYPIISISFWWSLICIGFIPKFLLFGKNKTKTQKIIYAFTCVPVFLFLILFIIFDQRKLIEIYGEGYFKYISYFPVIDYVFSFYLSLCILYRKYIREIVFGSGFYIKGLDLFFIIGGSNGKS